MWGKQCILETCGGLFGWTNPSVKIANNKMKIKQLNALQGTCCCPTTMPSAFTSKLSKVLTNRLPTSFLAKSSSKLSSCWTSPSGYAATSTKSNHWMHLRGLIILPLTFWRNACWIKESLVDAVPSHRVGTFKRVLKICKAVWSVPSFPCSISDLIRHHLRSKRHYNNTLWSSNISIQKRHEA